MNSLWLDTASKYLYVGVKDEDNLLYGVQYIGSNNHSERLLEVVKEVVLKAGLTPNDIKRVVVGIGPGSYTGLRVSLTIAKMFAWSLNIVLYTISSLHFALSGYTQDNLYLVKLRAKKDFYYCALIEKTKGIDNIIMNDQYLSSSEVDSIINKYPQVKVICEDDFLYNPININVNQLLKVENIYTLEPNYLRDVL